MPARAGLVAHRAPGPLERHCGRRKTYDRRFSCHLIGSDRFRSRLLSRVSIHDRRDGLEPVQLAQADCLP
uniref:Uncharacterized protein n=1 Tax=Ralstonia solanacearum TaxID=305 RepID=A0A809DWQ3_RALSL